MSKPIIKQWGDGEGSKPRPAFLSLVLCRPKKEGRHLYALPTQEQADSLYRLFLHDLQAIEEGRLK